MPGDDKDFRFHPELISYLENRFQSQQTEMRQGFKEIYDHINSHTKLIYIGFGIVTTIVAIVEMTRGSH